MLNQEIEMHSPLWQRMCDACIISCMHVHSFSVQIQSCSLHFCVLQANVGRYDASARYYVRALSLNPQAVNVWGYLRTSLACSGKLELMPAVDEENLQHLQLELPIE